MNEFVPSGYLPLKEALEYFGQLKHPDKWESEKASSKQEFQQLLFEGNLSAKLFTDYGELESLPSRDWGGVGAERIFETGRSSISGGDYYFPDEVRGRVLIKQASIDALFDGDSDDPSQSSKGQEDAPLAAVEPRSQDARTKARTARDAKIQHAAKQAWKSAWKNGKATSLSMPSARLSTGGAEPWLPERHTNPWT